MLLQYLYFYIIYSLTRKLIRLLIIKKKILFLRFVSIGDNETKKRLRIKSLRSILVKLMRSRASKNKFISIRSNLLRHRFDIFILLFNSSESLNNIYLI
jgi:hypothetical protein